MWTKESRGRYDRSKLRYPSDLTDEEWALVAPPRRRMRYARRPSGAAISGQWTCARAVTA